MLTSTTTQIDVKKASDVQAAFQFSSRTGVPLVIKNTGVCFEFPWSLLVTHVNIARLCRPKQFGQFAWIMGQCPVHYFPSAILNADHSRTISNP
jgi:hypothetical protein